LALAVHRSACRRCTQGKREKDPLSKKPKIRGQNTFEQAPRPAQIEPLATRKKPGDRATFLNLMQTNTSSRFGTLLLAELTSSDVQQVILLERRNAPDITKKLILGVCLKVPASEGLDLLWFDTAPLTASNASKKMNYGTNIATWQIVAPKRHIGGETLCPTVVCFQTMK
jgi:hypothetical protein